MSRWVNHIFYHKISLPSGYLLCVWGKYKSRQQDLAGTGEQLRRRNRKPHEVLGTQALGRWQTEPKWWWYSPSLFQVLSCLAQDIRLEEPLTVSSWCWLSAQSPWVLHWPIFAFWEPLLVKHSLSLLEWGGYFFLNSAEINWVLTGSRDRDICPFRTIPLPTTPWAPHWKEGERVPSPFPRLPPKLKGKQDTGWWPHSQSSPGSKTEALQGTQACVVADVLTALKSSFLL